MRGSWAAPGRWFFAGSGRGGGTGGGGGFFFGFFGFGEGGDAGEWLVVRAGALAEVCGGGKGARVVGGGCRGWGCQRTDWTRGGGWIRARAFAGVVVGFMEVVRGMFGLLVLLLVVVSVLEREALPGCEALRAVDACERGGGGGKIEWGKTLKLLELEGARACFGKWLRFGGLDRDGAGRSWLKGVRGGEGGGSGRFLVVGIRWERNRLWWTLLKGIAG